jgi:hypothetical protein
MYLKLFDLRMMARLRNWKALSSAIPEMKDGRTDSNSEVGVERSGKSRTAHHVGVAL